MVGISAYHVGKKMLLAPNNITLVKTASKDDTFLFELFKDCRRDMLLSLAHLDSPKRLELIEIQQSLQEKHYKSYYPNATSLIIRENKTSIGRLYLQEDKDSILIVDIALVSAKRGTGIGSTIMEQILSRANIQNKIVRLQVSKSNKAKQLYLKLGFTVVAENEIYLQMEFKPKKNNRIVKSLHNNLKS